MGHRKQQVELGLSKPLRKLLRRWLEPYQSSLEQRLAAVEQRLEQLEQQSPSTPQRSDRSTDQDTGIFFTDADDELPALGRRQQDSYQAWKQHYELHPEDVEPGRTVHEMAALRATTQSPISRTGIDQQG